MERRDSMKKNTKQFHAFRGMIMFFMLLTIGTFTASMIRDIATCISLNQTIKTNEARRDELTERSRILKRKKPICPIRIMLSSSPGENIW